MKAYKINSSINYLEIDPSCIDEGMKYATKNKCKNIRIITLNDNSGSKYDVSFCAFKDKNFIENLIISDDFKIGKVDTIESIYTLKNLTSLQLQQFLDIDFENLTQLKILYYKHNIKCKNLSLLVNLEDFLSTSTRADDCYFFSDLTNLKRVRINGNMKKIDGIEKLVNLNELYVTYSPKLEDVTAIGKMKILKKLHIEKCKNITDYSFLESNQTIEDLFIDELSDFGFIQTMTELKKLNFWNCKSGNLNPLLHSPKLKDVSFYPNKKHYTHTKEEVIHLLTSK